MKPCCRKFGLPRRNGIPTARARSVLLAIGWLNAALLTSGCATITYRSPKSAAVVAECIATGWRKVARSGLELPVSWTWSGDHHRVDITLARDFPTYLPLRSCWAKIKPDSPGDAGGSSTEYRRNCQISHGRIDRVVEDCQ